MAVIGAFAAAASVVGYIVVVASDAPDIQELKPVDQGASSEVFASNGRRLGFIENDEVRQPVTTGKLPTSLKQATIAIEDERFYKHKGVDYEGVVRAAIKNLRSGETVQGGSTLTMQLVRNIYPIGRKRDFKRKIKEAKLAQELEDEHPKVWILTNYLNSVPYGTVGGRTAIGAEAAARVFFDKPASKLTLPEAATLAGLPQAPSLYNPFRDPRAALSRRNDVLRRMRKLRMISDAEYQQAAAAPLGAKSNDYYFTKRESYFFDYVKEQLIERYGLETVRKGGLRIYTTIDLGKQKAARSAMKGQLPYSDDPSSAIVSIDPRNGYIRAMASSSSYRQVKYNYAAQGRRQAGSTFKVMVLMAALRKGINPNTTTYVSHKLNLNTPYGPWEVNTYSNSYGGSMNLVTATLQSDNTVYAQLDLDVGPDAVRQAAYDMGITTKLDGYPAEGLGGLRLGVSPLEMANAYATIASFGIRHKPIAVKKVVFPDGKSEDLGKPKGKRTFSQGTAWEATKILEQNIQRGTGTGANIGCPAAGKTGTVDDWTDAWFIGYTPKLTTATWVGYPNQKVLDAQRARDPGGRRHDSRLDLARLHGERRHQGLLRLPASGGQRELPAVLRQVLVQRLLGRRRQQRQRQPAAGPEQERLAEHRPGQYRRAAGTTPTSTRPSPRLRPRRRPRPPAAAAKTRAAARATAAAAERAAGPRPGSPAVLTLG